MLQRAASNAYSWWVASHIRTKQSKWLEESLQDMEEKVQVVLKLIQEDGDSFAKRAEMYYKKRPELISFVEETYRAYRALAERYDHISKELQNANSTLASAFPDQFQFAMDDDDDCGPPKPSRRGFVPKQNTPKIPEAPKQFPSRNIKAIIALAQTKGNSLPDKKPAGRRGKKISFAPKSGMNKDQAVAEIDKLQKTILTKQTEKEFTKSSYEKGVAKCWQIDEEITQMQQKISKLQDEFEVNKPIEDDEARTLMAEAALKSCQETLAQLLEKQRNSALEAKAEREKIKLAHNKLLSLKGKFLGGNDGTNISEHPTERGQEATSNVVKETLASFEDGGAGVDGSSQTKELEMLRDKIKEHFETASSLSVSEMAEKIDEIVDKVTNLEASIFSQTAVIQRLRSETDDFQTQIKTLEDDKVDLIDGKNTLNQKLKEMEDRMKGLQDLDQNVERRNSSLQAKFLEANQDLADISEKLPNVKLDKDLQDSLRGIESASHASGVQKLKKENDGQNELVSQASGVQKPEKEHDGQKELVSQESRVQKLEKENDGQNELISQASGVHKPEKEHDGQKELVSQQSQVQKLEKENDGHKALVSQESEVQKLKKENDDQKDDKIEGSSPFVLPQGKEEAISIKEQRDPSSIHLDKFHEDKEKVKEKTDSPLLSDKSPAVSSTPKYKQETSPESLTHSQVAKQQIEEKKAKKQEDEEDEESNEQQMNENDDKERVPLDEYNSILQSYEDVKRRLGELENKNLKELNELRSLNAKKDEEILSLQTRLLNLQKRLDEPKNTGKDQSTDPSETDEFDIRFLVQSAEMSVVEEKLRADIDEVLEENLDFWLRFSTSFSQIQKFQDESTDLQKDLEKIEERRRKEGASSGRYLKSDLRPIYKHLKEIQTDLQLWVENSVSLKDELQRRFTQICNIQEDIKRALNDGAVDDEMKFTSYQAAKFQGEVLNMKQENNKVADELQAGLDHVTNLLNDVERTVNRLGQKLGIHVPKSEPHTQQPIGNQVPLKSFIFGVKPKKQKQSILSCVHPALQKKYQQLKSGDL